MKQIPNLFTLLNLFFGCIACVFALQAGLVPLYNADNLLLVPDVSNLGTQYVSIPEQTFYASLFIGIAAVIDFLDGFIARLLKAESDMGKQLDSLADVVSFGAAPSLIVFNFLRLSFAQQQDGLSVNFILLTPAFIIACAGAYRLARFNLQLPSADKNFKGVPIPAAGLLIAGFPLIYWTNSITWVTTLLISKWFWYAFIIIISWLMFSKKPMLALKFSAANKKAMLPFIVLAAVAIIAAFTLHWLAVPVTFIAYVLLSLFAKQTVHDV